MTEKSDVIRILKYTHRHTHKTTTKNQHTKCMKWFKLKKESLNQYRWRKARQKRKRDHIDWSDGGS